jgi:hypothetical protein
MTQATDTDIREIRDLLLGLDKKLDGVEKKLDVHIATTSEQFKSLDIQISDLKRNTDTQLTDIRLQLRSLDNRFWGMVTLLATALLGTHGKVIFFPIDKV